MAKMTIDTEQMQEASTKLNGGATNLLQQIAAFRSQVDSLLASGWVAPSGTAFGAAYQEWHVAANNMTTALQSISRTISSASSTFASADSASTVK